MNSTALKPQLERLQSAWRQLAPRERLGVLLAGGVLLFTLTVLLLVSPALKTLRTAPGQLAQLDQELARMQAWAAEARQLQALPAVSPAQAQAALQAATERLGAGARLNLQGDRATLQFNELGAEALAGWLVEVRSAARARAVEAHLQRGPRGYGGSVVLQLGGAT